MSASLITTPSECLLLRSLLLYRLAVCLQVLVLLKRHVRICSLLTTFVISASQHGDTAKCLPL